MKRFIMIIALLFVGATVFSQECPKDSIEGFYLKQEGVYYSHETVFKKNTEGKCISTEYYWVILGNGKRIKISKEDYDKAKSKNS